MNDECKYDVLQLYINTNIRLWMKVWEVFKWTPPPLLSPPPFPIPLCPQLAVFISE